MGTTTSRLRVYQFHHLGNTTFETLTAFVTLMLFRESFLLLSLRNVSSRSRIGLLLLKHRNIICSRLLPWRFDNRWIWQTYLSQLLSFLFSKVT